MNTNNKYLPNFTCVPNNLRQISVETASDNFSGNTYHSAPVRTKDEIPPQYQKVFEKYQFFNAVQSKVFDHVFYSDDNLVVSAPTGSGKTAIFELALVKLLMNFEYNRFEKAFKVVYVAPMKSLCEERLVDWNSKFADYGINCICVTGDSDHVDVNSLINHNLIITTPEKWDVLTRRWKDNQKLVELIQLFMIDEVHLLNEEIRGATLEVVVSRMKIIQDRIRGANRIRFLALSATFPNIEDIAEWLGGCSSPCAKYLEFSEEMRPVPLQKIILGYSYNPNQSTPFKFDIMLNYRLQAILLKYAEGRPTLIFCSTRKSVEMTAKHISQNITMGLNPKQKQILLTTSRSISDTNVRALLIHGVACHHAGMLPENRRIIEELFRNGDLPILVTTSTLAMGVNLPAHLVIVKSTKCFIAGGYQDYSESAILQMIGRAGRPTFDTKATAVIMTTSADKERYENLVCGNNPVESNLHRHLTEHLNSEVVLYTITDLSVAMQWLTSTFLYIRARKKPNHYGLPVGLTSEQIDKKLLDMCQIEINKLAKYKMLDLDVDINMKPTFTGCLMAKYYVAFETMKLFTQVTGSEKIPQMLVLIAKCKEFSEIYLRVNDKKTLNILNKCSNKETIRYPLNGRIQTIPMKINCIIQAVFGNLQILEHSLLNESQKIMRSGERIVKCLVEYLSSKEYISSHTRCFQALLTSITLAKCFHAHLWENSPFVSRQLAGIGAAMSGLLVGAGKTSFEALLIANPRDLERILNRKSPFGDTIVGYAKRVPKYQLDLQLVNEGELKLAVRLLNVDDLREGCTVDVASYMCLLVGDSEENLMFYERYTHSFMMQHVEVVKFLQLTTTVRDRINAHFVSETWVGFDCENELEFQKPKLGSHVQSFLNMYMKKTKGAPSKRKTSQKSSNVGRPLKELMNEIERLSQEECIKGKQNVEKGEGKKGKRSKLGNFKFSPTQTTLDKYLARREGAKYSGDNKKIVIEDEDCWMDEIDMILGETDVKTQERSLDEDDEELLREMDIEDPKNGAFDVWERKLVEKYTTARDLKSPILDQKYATKDSKKNATFNLKCPQTIWRNSPKEIDDTNLSTSLNDSLKWSKTSDERKQVECARFSSRIMAECTPSATNGVDCPNILPGTPTEREQKKWAERDLFNFQTKKPSAPSIPTLNNTNLNFPIDSGMFFEDMIVSKAKNLTRDDAVNSLPTKKTKFDETCDGKDQTYCTKNIKWRSPLVTSPSGRFSPYLSPAKSEAQTGNTAIKRKRCAKFALSDKEYKNASQNSSFQEKEVDNLGDVCSDTLLDNLGLKQNKSRSSDEVQRVKLREKVKQNGATEPIMVPTKYYTYLKSQQYTKSEHQNRKEERVHSTTADSSRDSGDLAQSMEPIGGGSILLRRNSKEFYSPNEHQRNVLFSPTTNEGLYSHFQRPAHIEDDAPHFVGQKHFLPFQEQFYRNTLLQQRSNAPHFMPTQSFNNDYKFQNEETPPFKNFACANPAFFYPPKREEFFHQQPQQPLFARSQNLPHQHDKENYQLYPHYFQPPTYRSHIMSPPATHPYAVPAYYTQFGVINKGPYADPYYRGQTVVVPEAYAPHPNYFMNPDYADDQHERKKYVTGQYFNTMEPKKEF